MRRFFLGIFLPILLVSVVVGGVWLFVRNRATPPTASSTGTASSPAVSTLLSPPAPIKGVMRGELQVPTPVNSSASAAAETEFIPDEFLAEGESGVVIVEPYVLDEEPVAAPSTPPPAATPPVTVPLPSTSGTTDEDRDGLTLDQELQQNTSPSRADTDGDGLADGDEVRRYRTDPLNPDTDGDSYSDGQEVTGGYNPNGPGRL